MIDPLEAVIALAENDADLRQLTEGRVAARHRFGESDRAWPLQSKALQLRYDGGTPDLYTPRQMVRLEARCFGESQSAASQVYGSLVALTRNADRKVIQTGEGKALVYWLLMASGPSFLQDPDTQMPFILVFLDAAVSEQDIP